MTDNRYLTEKDKKRLSDFARECRVNAGFELTIKGRRDDKRKRK